MDVRRVDKALALSCVVIS